MIRKKKKKKRKISDAFLLCLCFDVCVVVLCVCVFDFFSPKSNICMQKDESCGVFHHYERPKWELGDLNHSNSVNEGKE